MWGEMKNWSLNGRQGAECWRETLITNGVAGGRAVRKAFAVQEPERHLGKITTGLQLGKDLAQNLLMVQVCQFLSSLIV